MAIFFLRRSRQRLREAARQSLSVPVFAARNDYSPLITGGLWPQQLSAVTAQNAWIADRLRGDLQRITDAANAELNHIQHTATSYAERKIQEERVVTRARHFAAQQVESTVRQLSSESLAPLAGGLGAGQSPKVTAAAVSGPGVNETAVNDVPRECAHRLEPHDSVAEVVAAPILNDVSRGDRDDSARHGHTSGEVLSATADDGGLQAAGLAAKSDEAFAGVVAPAGAFESSFPDRPFGGRSESERDMSGRDTSVVEPIGAVSGGVCAPRPDTADPKGYRSFLASEQDLPLDTTTQPAENATAAIEAQRGEPAVVEQAAEARHAKPDAEGAASSWYNPPVVEQAALAWVAKPAVADAHVVRQPEASDEGEPPAGCLELGYDDAVADPAIEPAAVKAAPSPPLRRRGVEPHNDEERLRLLLTFVARQEPGLNWVIGARKDGTTVLATDIACGWIPPDITLPADVCLLPPGRRAGSAAELIGSTTQLAARAPSDPLDWSADLSGVKFSIQPRQLPRILDLGWELREATRWRDGLPRMVNTLAVAGAAGTGIAEAELGLLRVHHDTVLYQLLADYPDSDPPVLSNALLLFAAESIASGDRLSANYHFSWFRALGAQS